MKRPEGFDGSTHHPRKPNPPRASKPELSAQVSKVERGQTSHLFARVRKKRALPKGAETQPRQVDPQKTEDPVVPEAAAELNTEGLASDIVTVHRDEAATQREEGVDAHSSATARRASDTQSSGVRGARADLKRAERERRLRERGERKRFTAHFRSQRRRWLTGISAVLGLALFVIAGVFTPVMAVREIRVEGAQTVNVEELRTTLGRFEGVPLALVNDQDVHRAIETFPLVQRYAIERIPPHTLVVRIEERTPVIALERDEKFDLIDPAGVLLGRADERPVGVPLGSAELTDTSSPAFRAVATVIRDLPQELREQLVAARATSAQDVMLTLASGTEVIWGDSSDIQRKAAVLQALLAAIGQPAMIDVSAPDAPIFT